MLGLAYLLLVLICTWLIYQSTKGKALFGVFSDVVLCYLLGIVLASTKAYVLPESLLTQWDSSYKTFAEISVLLALPILLMLHPARQWLFLSGPLLKAFGLGLLALLFWAWCCAQFWASSLPEVKTAAGMLVGVFSGGTPNMVSVQKALGGSENLFIMLNASDTLCSGLYVVFLTSFAKKTLVYFLKPEVEQPQFSFDFSKDLLVVWSWPRAVLGASLLSVLVLAVALFFAWFFSDNQGNMNMLVLMLILTALGVLLSFWPRLLVLKPALSWAHYLLLVFAFSAGALADFGTIFAQGGDFVLFTFVLLYGYLIIHLLLARLFGIGLYTWLMASTAAVFGPPFVSQVGLALRAEAWVPAGVALGVLGLALGNYLGLLLVALL